MSKSLIPLQFLFRFALDCRYQRKMPLSGPHIVDLPESHRLAYMGTMDGQPTLCDLRMAWNERGLGVQWSTVGKTEPIHGETDKPTQSDGLSLWIDMRDSRSGHRATRFCQRFLLLAHDGTPAGLPEVRTRPIHRAVAEPPTPDLSGVKVSRFALDEEGEIVDRGKVPLRDYRMEVFLPAAAFPDFDPDNNNRWGLCYRFRDRELGDQTSAASAHMPYWEDPSLWSTLRLVGNAKKE